MWIIRRLPILFACKSRQNFFAFALPPDISDSWQGTNIQRTRERKKQFLSTKRRVVHFQLKYLVLITFHYFIFPPVYENEDALLWDPSRLEDSDVESFLDQIQTPNQGTQDVNSIPSGTHIRDDEKVSTKSTTLHFPFISCCEQCTNEVCILHCWNHIFMAVLVNRNTFNIFLSIKIKAVTWKHYRVNHNFMVKLVIRLVLLASFLPVLLRTLLNTFWKEDLGLEVM